MNNIDKLTKELAEACREKKINFMIVIERNGIYSQTSINDKSRLRKLVDVLKTI